MVNAQVEIDDRDFEQIQMHKFLSKKWNDPYFIRLAIYDHLNELQTIYQNGKLPLNDDSTKQIYVDSFDKELIDLSILICFLTDTDSDKYSQIYFSRYQKFLNKMGYADWEIRMIMQGKRVSPIIFKKGKQSC